MSDDLQCIATLLCISTLYSQTLVYAYILTTSIHSKAWSQSLLRVPISVATLTVEGVKRRRETIKSSLGIPFKRQGMILCKICDEELADGGRTSNLQNYPKREHLRKAKRYLLAKLNLERSECRKKCSLKRGGALQSVLVEQPRL